MDIVITGSAGLDGSRKIYQHKEYRRKLLMKYSERFFGVFESGTVSVHEETARAAQRALEECFRKAREAGLAADGGDGGILAALWRVLKARRSGGFYDLRAIPVLQQTVEICEMFELNPYRLYAPSCRVWLTEQPGEILRDAAGAGVPSAVIGYTGGGVAIWRTDTNVPSSLRRPERDEMPDLN